MPRPRKVTLVQVNRVRAVYAARRALLQALDELPTLEQLAGELGVSVSTVKQITRAYRCERST